MRVFVEQAKTANKLESAQEKKKRLLKTINARQSIVIYFSSSQTN
jgi:hypothetical protein